MLLEVRDVSVQFGGLRAVTRWFTRGTADPCVLA